MKKKIVFFGSINVAKKCLEFLIKNLNNYSFYVVTEKIFNKKNQVYYFCQKNKIKIKSLEKITETRENYEYGFSIRFNKILKKKLIKKFKKGIINMHGGPLPQYRGSANHIHAIINNEKKFGVTLHYINEKIDCGDILSIKKFPITKDDTGYSLLNKTFFHGYNLFKKIVIDIKLNKKLKSFKQKLMHGKTYMIKDLNKYKNIKIRKLNKNKIINLLRAFYHPEKNFFNFINDRYKLIK